MLKRQIRLKLGCLDGQKTGQTIRTGSSYFFEKSVDAFRIEYNDFHHASETDRQPAFSTEDGQLVLILANAPQ